jgi:hypothetical protein
METGATDSGGCATATGVTGTLGGQTLSPAHAVALKGVNDASYPNQITVFLTNVSNLCSLLQTTGSFNKANLRTLGFVLGATSSSAPPVAPGTYTQMNTTDEMTASYSSSDATCQMTDSPWMGGSVTACGVGASYTGTFDLTFGTDHVTGTFDAPLCELNQDGSAAGDGGATCMP